MLKFGPNSKIYVYCPANVVTGGAELLHQLVDLLNNYKRTAFIVYYGNDDLNKIPESYEKYNIQVALNVEDHADNILIIYEAIFNKINDHKSIQKMLWWLSVDNFFYCGDKYLTLKALFGFNFYFGLKMAVYRLYLLLFKNNNTFKHDISIEYLASLNVVNAYQSEYAQHFLINNGFKTIVPLSDYINTDFYAKDHIKERENVILYNPKKGLSFTKKIIEFNKFENYRWIPLEGMSRGELQEKFRTSKLYIDFGFHPGKDRLPREAAINGCCVITGLRGSSRFFEDVPIFNEYKFSDKSQKIKLISSKIHEIMDNYAEIQNDYGYYRDQILSEKKVFAEQAKLIFKIKD